MQEYFKQDYKELQETDDTDIFLKRVYDDMDCIFEKRFEKQKENADNGSISEMKKVEKSGELKESDEEKRTEKSKKIKEIISQVKRKVPTDDTTNIKMASLVLRNAYLRLAQCQNEIFEQSKNYYQKANFYLEGYVGYSVQDEIDLLMMLNKGKYFRNTAEAGKKSDYTRAYNIFSNIEKYIDSVDITERRQGLYSCSSCTYVQIYSKD